MLPHDGQAPAPDAGEHRGGEMGNGGGEVEIIGNTDESQSSSYPGCETQDHEPETEAFYRDAAAPLAALGWVPVPVEPNSKAVKLEMWTTLPISDLVAMADRYSHHGVGLRLGDGVAVLDVDTTDLDLTERLWTLYQCFIGGPVRVGKKGFGVPFRLSAEDAAELGTEENWEIVEGQTVQILGRSRQLVAYGVHPDTGTRYRWYNGHPLITPVSALPLVSLERLRFMLRSLAGASPKVKKAGGGRLDLSAVAGRGGRDNQLTAVAGHCVRCVLRGEVSLLRALDEVRGWVELRSQKVAGDNLDPDEGVRKLIRFLVGDVRDKQRVLPRGWDEGLSDINKADLGLDFDEDEQEQTFDKIVAQLVAELYLAGDPSEKMEATKKTLVRVHRSPSLTPTMVESILRTCLKKSGLNISLGSLQKQLKELKERASFDYKDRPVIKLIASGLPASIDAMERALIAGDPGIFQRGDRVVRLGEQEVPTFKGEKLKTTRLYPVDANNLCERAMRVAHFEKFDARKNDVVQTKCPNDVASTYLSRVGEWSLPTLTGFVTTPTLRADGSILNTPGYDPTTGILYQPNAEFPELLDMPTREDAMAALTLLTDLVGTFKFVSSTDRAVWLSLVLTSVVRRSLDTAPLHAFSAPVAGSGKSKLVDLAAIIATGGRAGVITQADGDTELEKRLVTELLDGSPFIAIDNCTRPLGGDLLCAALTQTEVKLRVLGESRAPQVLTNATTAATGNGFRVKGDMGRRTLVCRLDPGVERPELLAFDFDPIEVVERERGKYVIAALTILRAYAVSGSSSKAQPLNSFANWSRRVRDALVWLGEPDAVGTQAQLREEDPERKSAIEVLSQWHEVIGDEPVTVNRVIKVVTDQHLAITPGARNFVTPEFREALLSVAGRGGSVHGRALGEWLSGIKDRIIEGMKIEHAGVRGGVALWRLVNFRG